jgi:hypothetical protein
MLNHSSQLGIDTHKSVFQAIKPDSDIQIDRNRSVEVTGMLMVPNILDGNPRASLSL